MQNLLPLAFLRPARWREFLRKLWLSWAPGCYCHECGQCQHLARYRFYGRYLNSCEVCLTCPNSHTLWAPWQNGAGHTKHFEMSRTYRAQYWLAGLIHYLGAKASPKDPKSDTQPGAGERTAAKVHPN